MKAKKKTSTVRKSTASKNAGAAKRGTSTKAGGKGAEPAPTAKRFQRSQTSRSTPEANKSGEAAAQSTGAKVQSRPAARTAKPPKAETVAEAENPQEKQNAIRRFINILKRVIGYKKGERNEFRYNNVTGHPNYEYQNKDGKVKAFGITHKSSTFGRKNMPLSQNPEKGKSEDSYIRNGIINADEEVLSGKVLHNFKLAREDIPNVKSKKRYHKKESQRQKAKRSNKKSK